MKRLGVEDVGASFAGRVAYHSTCHSLRVTRVGDAPLRLLRNVRGLELVDLPRADECCGFGGTFAIKNAETSSAMLADKCDAIESTGAAGLHRRRQLVPAPDRRRALTTRLRRATRPHRRDPRVDMTSFPEAARVELANVQLRTNLRNATDTIRAKRARVVGGAARLGGASRGRKARSRRTCSRTSRSTCSSSKRPSRQQAATSTGRATPPRRTPSSRRSPARTASTRS